MTKEETYDAEIAPLMTKIIEVCQREKIALLANFQLSGKGEPDLRVTTALLSDEYGPSKEQVGALSLIQDGFVAFTRTPRKD